MNVTPDLSKQFVTSVELGKPLHELTDKLSTLIMTDLKENFPYKVWLKKPLDKFPQPITAYLIRKLVLLGGRVVVCLDVIEEGAGAHITRCTFKLSEIERMSEV